MTTTPERLKHLDVAALGGGRFAVSNTTTDDIYTVNIEKKTQELRCTCEDNQRYRYRCIHIAAVLTDLSQMMVLPEEVEIPDPLDVRQMNDEAIMNYLLKINKALNLLTTRNEAALEEEVNASLELEAAKLKKKTIKEHKGDPADLEAAQLEETAASARSKRAKLEINIIKGRTKSLEGSRITAMGIQKRLA